MTGDNKENKEAEVKKYSLECCFDRNVQQYNDEVITSEVTDFVREVIEAVSYTVSIIKTITLICLPKKFREMNSTAESISPVALLKRSNSV